MLHDFRSVLNNFSFFQSFQISLKRRLDVEVEVLRLEKRLKTENDKAAKKDIELTKVKEQLREAQHANEKLLKELEMIRTGEQNLNVMKYSEIYE